MDAPEWMRLGHFKLMYTFSMLPPDAWTELCVQAEQGQPAARERLYTEFNRLGRINAYAGYPGGDMSLIRPASLVQSEYRRYQLPCWLSDMCKQAALAARESKQ